MSAMDGIEATRQLATEGHSCRVLIVTTFDLDEYVLEGLRAGASGFLLKDVTPERLVEAVRVVAAGDALLAPRATRRLLDALAHRIPRRDAPTRRALDSLTAREHEVLGHVAAGWSNAEIARTLHVEETTVKTHVSRLLTKLGARSRTQAVTIAHGAGTDV